MTNLEIRAMDYMDNPVLNTMLGLSAPFMTLKDAFKLINLTSKSMTSSIDLKKNIFEMITHIKIEPGYSMSFINTTISTFKQIISLDMNFCDSLTSLPDRIGDLVHLKTLNLSYCVGLASLPNRIGDLVQLKTLNLSQCTGLTVLPDRIDRKSVV